MAEVVTGTAAPAAVEGILHLAALSVALLVAYVGLDRIHPPDNLLQNEINKTKLTVSDLLQQLEAVRPDGTIVFVYEIFAVFVLCHVAGRKIRVGSWKKIKNFLRLQAHVPLLFYFRNRFDIKMVSAMALVSTVLFLISTSATIWQIDFVHSRAFLIGSFIWYLFTLIFIFGTVIASSKLLRIGATCNAMRDKMNDRLTEMVEFKVTAANIPSNGATPGH